MIQLDLPKPPSLNNIYANVPGKGRVRSKPYRAWRIKAAQEILIQGRPSMRGRYELEIRYRRRPNCDLGNLEKAVSDALVHAGVVEDDRHSDRICLWWDDSLPAGVDCRVHIKPVGGMSNDA